MRNPNAANGLIQAEIPGVLNHGRTSINAAAKISVTETADEDKL
jgi:hypothetical protein